MSTTNTSTNASPESSGAPSNRPVLDRGSDRWKQSVLLGEEEINDGSNKCRSQKIYEALDNSKKVLVTLCVGLVQEDGNPLIDLTKSPWSQELKGSMKPTNRELAMEVCRRQKLFAGTDGTATRQFSMKPNNKPREVLIEWLKNWPILNAECLFFLFTEAKRVEGLLQASLDEGRENALAMQHGAWTGALPYLRLIHAITDCSETRMAYLKRNDPLTREELDALTSPIRPKTAYEIIADKWNDPDFHPVTRVTNCHVDFASAIDLCHSKVASLTPADALGVQNRLSSIRVTLLRIIEKWEQSGQGDGGRFNDNDNDEEQQETVGWGKLEGRTQEALDSRENFLGSAPSWYLYFWEIADTFQLLDSTLQRLSENVGAADATSLSIVSRRRRRNDTSVDGAESSDGSLTTSVIENMVRISEVLQQLVDTSALDRQAAKKMREDDQVVTRKNMEAKRLIEKEQQIEQRISQLRDAIDEYEEKFELSKKQFYKKIIDRKEGELKELEKLLEQIVAARTSNNNASSFD